MTITDELFRRDGYLKECNAVVVTAHDGVIVTDQTVFYPCLLYTSDAADE